MFFNFFSVSFKKTTWWSNLLFNLVTTHTHVCLKVLYRPVPE